MNRRLFIFVVILMGISMAGIILLQLFWIRNAISIREEQFNKTVNLALRETSEKLESHENILLLSEEINKFSKPGILNVRKDSLESTIIIYGDSSSGTSYQYSLTADAGSDYVVNVWTEDDHEAEIVEYKHEVSIDSLRSTVARVKANVHIDSLSTLLMILYLSAVVGTPLLKDRKMVT